MSDLIDRQSVIDELEERKYANRTSVPVVSELNRSIGYIMRLPSVQSGREKAKWIRTGEDGYCSNCKCDMPMFKEDWQWTYCETDFCPNCGAKMECQTDTPEESVPT